VPLSHGGSSFDLCPDLDSYGSIWWLSFLSTVASFFLLASWVQQFARPQLPLIFFPPTILLCCLEICSYRIGWKTISRFPFPPSPPAGGLLFLQPPHLKELLPFSQRKIFQSSRCSSFFQCSAFPCPQTDHTSFSPLFSPGSVFLCAYGAFPHQPIYPSRNALPFC